MLLWHRRRSLLSQSETSFQERKRMPVVLGRLFVLN
jgi:hypothetical protein